MEITKKVINTSNYVLTLNYEEWLLFRHVVFCKTRECDNPIKAEEFRKQLMSKLDGRIPEVQS
jgi:hypothetical protein